MVKVGRILLRLDAGLLEGGGGEVEALGTPGAVSTVAPSVDECAKGIPARTRWSSWMRSSALP